MSETTLSIEKKLKGQVSEISFIDSESFIASSTSQAQIWKKDNAGKDFQVTGYINGQFTYSDKLISTGVINCNTHSGKVEYNDRYIKTIVAAFVPHYQGREEQFEVSYALPLPKKDRIVLALRFRPTRHPTRKDPKPEPQDVIGLVKLSDASLVAILDSGSFFIRRPIVQGDKLYYGCDELACWDLTTGKQEAEFEFFRLYEFTNSDNGVFVFLENGELWNAAPSGDMAKLANLPVTIKKAVYIPERKVIIAGDDKNGLHVISVNDSKYEIRQTLELEGEADGIFLNPDHKYVYVPVYLSDVILKVRVE